MRVLGALGGLALLVACGVSPKAPPSPITATLEYAVDSSRAPAITVTAHFVTTGATVVALPEEMAATLTAAAIERGGQFVALPLGNRFDVPECRVECRLRYTLELSRADRSFDTVMESGGGFISPTYAWMARPLPLPTGTTRVSVDGPPLPPPVPGSEVFVDARAHSAATATGFSNDGFSEGSFTAFGALRIAPLAAPGAEIDLVRIGPVPKLGEPGLVRWARDAANSVAQLYGRFPVAKASVFVVPIRDADEVVFGKALSLGGPAVLALTGLELEESAIHDDWVLVHEMVHLGAPTFVGPLRWLGEGTATYYEAVLRTRSGFRTPKALWGEFARSMPRGAPKHRRALDDGSGIDDVYWGGAVFLLAADVALRERGSSLDEVMRGVLAEGGDGTQVWSITRFCEAADRITKTHVMSEMYARHGKGDERIDLEKLLRDLGVEGSGESVRLREEGRLVGVRKAIEGK